MTELFRRGHRSRLMVLNVAMLALLGLVVLSLVYWSAVRVTFLADREDNPRGVEAELRIRRGRILDANEVVLAQNGGTPERQVREYPLPIAEPAVGYYSLRYGTAGVEEALDPILRGTTSDPAILFAREVFNQPASGADVRLTLDITLQANATRLLEGRRAAAVLLSIPDGAIRAMVSLPSFDPNVLEETFDLLAGDAAAPLLNRVTQGVYQPGLVLQPFLAAAALEAGDLRPADLPAVFDGQTFDLVSLEGEWTAADFTAAVTDFGFLSAPEIPIPVGAPASGTVEDLGLALRGEENLTVTPLQVALAAASLGTQGQHVKPQLVSGVRQDGRWQAYRRQQVVEAPRVSGEAAARVLSALPRGGSVAEYASTVSAGPNTSDSWYFGLAPASSPRFVVVVVVEGAASPEVAQNTGRRLLDIALN